MSAEDVDQHKEYEVRLRRRIEILQKQLAAGKITIADGLQTAESLKKIRRLPDGSVDLDTVDGLVRSLALGVTEMHDREKLKTAIPLMDIQNAYFDLIEKNFGFFYKQMVKNKATPHTYAAFVARNEKAVKELFQSTPDFLGTIEQFWLDTMEIAYIHLEDMHQSLKGVFGGDLFPSNDQNIVSKCGLYTDTIILPDPFLRSKEVFRISTKERQVYFLIKHGLNILQYKAAALADVLSPIVVVLPDRTVFEKDEKNFVFELGKRDALIHAEAVFGKKFASFEDMMIFTGELNTLEQVLPKVVNADRVLFDVEWTGSLREKVVRMSKSKDLPPNHKENYGHLVASYSVSRMSITNELLLKSRRLHGTPIIDAPTSWQYFVWKLEYDGLRAKKFNGLADLHVVKGLQSLANSDMKWLGKVPVDALIEIRKNGAISEIRGTLEKGISGLAELRPENFHRTADKIFDNINEAFAQHNLVVKELSEKKWKFAGSEIGSWLVTGAIAVTAVATGHFLWGLAALASDQVLDAPKLKDIPKSIKALAEETRKVKRSPVGMLFDCARKS